MKNRIMSYLKLNQNELKTTVGVSGALFLLVHIITLGAMLWGKDASAVLISSTLQSVVLGIIFLVLCLSDLMGGFDHMLAFGCTRRQSLACLLIGQGVNLVVCTLMIEGFAFLEKNIMPKLWMVLGGQRQISLEGVPYMDGGLAPSDILFIEDFSIGWWFPPLILVSAVLLGDLVGVMMHRFGRKAGVAIWIGGMFLSITSQFWHPIPESWGVPLLALGGILLAAAMGVSVWYLLHSSYRG